jgi:hypothetical protein
MHGNGGPGVHGAFAETTVEIACRLVQLGDGKGRWLWLATPWASCS